ncbi:hypothetical protein HKD24_11225 [Gluconobacter sp. LMG 31484]|uniref:Alpha/beta hydrolase n=1 Tax=Gluconobacter vitians TaxID=2728102 RepID=A0ABR9Y8M2_9PROT|nr:hypothetical protein [Gluconobacter vitians]MBF0859784.1 hypothetical protein [Gluconobacter vitians]
MLIFENEFYKLYHNQNKSDFCVVTFSAFDAPERHNNRFFLYEPSIKLKINTFGIVAKTDCWFVREEFSEVLEILREILPKDQKILLFGSSMGGFAAIKYSKLLSADYVLALAPQFSLDKSERDSESFYDQFYKNYMEGMGLKKKDAVGTIYIIYDPNKAHEDEINFHRIKSEIPEVEGIKIFYAGHVVMESLKGTDNFRQILNDISDNKKLRKTLHSIRRKNINNLTSLLLKASERHAGLVYNCLFSSNCIATGTSSRLINNRDFRRNIFAKFINDGEIYKIKDIINNFYIRTSSIYFGKEENVSEVYIFSYFGDLLYFCPENKSFCSYSNGSGVYPVVFDRKYNRLLYWDLFGKSKIEGNVALEIEGSFCAIKYNNHYLSAQPDGYIAGDRNNVNQWEKFLLIQA